MRIPVTDIPPTARPRAVTMLTVAKAAALDEAASAVAGAEVVAAAEADALPDCAADDVPLALS